MGEGLYELAITGRNGKPADMSFTPNGIAITKLSIAAVVRRKVEGSWQEDADWWNIVAWQDLAERVNKVITEPGFMLLVRGQPNPRAYINKQGQAAISRDLTLKEFYILAWPVKKDVTSSTSGSTGVKRKPSNEPDTEYEVQIDEDALDKAVF